MTARLNRRALTAGLLATIPAPAVASICRQLGDNSGPGDRLPDHAAFWQGLPLPRTLAQAWRSLDAATQAEIGAAVIGMHLAEYVYGDGLAEADRFLDARLRADASEVAHDLLNALGPRLHALLPDLYGPEGDHPAWAYAAGMVYPLGTILPEHAPLTAAEPDPVLAVIEAREAAGRRLAAVSAETAGDETPAADALWTAADRRLAAADDTLRATVPTTLAGLAALAQHYAARAGDPDGDGLTHLAEALAEYAA